MSVHLSAHDKTSLRSVAAINVSKLPNIAGVCGVVLSVAGFARARSISPHPPWCSSVCLPCVPLAANVNFFDACTSLQVLDMSKAHIATGDLRILRAMPLLRVLRLDSCYRLTG